MQPKTFVETGVEAVEAERKLSCIYKCLKEMAKIDNYIGGFAEGDSISFVNIFKKFKKEKEEDISLYRKTVLI